MSETTPAFIINGDITGERLEKIREIFARDAFATQAAGIRLDAAAERYARCSLTVEPRHLNGAGTIMGGAVFTLADFAFAVASNHEEMNTQSLTSQISFLSTARLGDTLTAEASCIKSGRSTCCYLITVSNQESRQIASVTTTGFIKH